MQIEIIEDAGLTLETAEKVLSRLEGERSALPGLMAQAAKAADVEGLRLVKRRAAEIADEIFAAKAGMLRLQLEAEEIRHAELQSELRELDAQLIESTAEAQRLQDAANQALERRGAIMLKAMAAEAASQNSHEAIGELRAQIDNLIGRASGQEMGERRAQFGLHGGKVFAPGSEAA
jgi:chromosome segregation ATPase